MQYYRARYLIAAQRNEFLFQALKNIFQHRKTNFVSPSSHVILYSITQTAMKHQTFALSFVTDLLDELKAQLILL